MREKLSNLAKLNERNDLLYKKNFISKEEYVHNLQTILLRLRDLKINEYQNKSITNAILADLNIENFKTCINTITFSMN